MIMKYIRNKIEKTVRAIMEEDDTQSYICDLVSANLGPIPDAQEIAEELSAYDVAQEVDISSLAYEIDMSDIVDYFDTEEIAERVGENFDMDYAELSQHIDTGEIASEVVDHLDLEAIAKHADVDKTIFTHIHMLETKIDALIEVVRQSAMDTLDLMTFNKGLEGEE